MMVLVNRPITELDLLLKNAIDKVVRACG
jgi:hypothetical protein